NPKSKIQNRKSKIENPKSKIQNRKSKIENPKSKVQNRKSKIENPKSKVQNRKSKIENPKSKVQNRKSKIESCPTSAEFCSSPSYLAFLARWSRCVCFWVGITYTRWSSRTKFICSIYDV